MCMVSQAWKVPCSPCLCDAHTEDVSQVCPGRIPEVSQVSCTPPGCLPGVTVSCTPTGRSHPPQPGSQFAGHPRRRGPCGGVSPRTAVRHRRPVTGSGDARGHGGLPAAGAPPCRAVPAAGLSREALPGRPAVASRGCQLAGASWPRAVTFAQPPAGGAALPGRPDVRPMTGTPPALSGGSAKVTPRPGRSSELRPTPHPPPHARWPLGGGPRWLPGPLRRWRCPNISQACVPAGMPRPRCSRPYKGLLVQPRAGALRGEPGGHRAEVGGPCCSREGAEVRGTPPSPPPCLGFPALRRETQGHSTVSAPHARKWSVPVTPLRCCVSPPQVTLGGSSPSCAPRFATCRRCRR